MDFFYAILGLLILLLAGDSLVRGAVNLSLRIGVPALIVSLTIVAFGTSAPELLIAIQAVHDHAPGLALGNVVGSNIANVLLVLGIPALFKSIHTRHCDTRGDYVTMMIASLLFYAIAVGGHFGPWQGIVLLTVLAAMLGSTFRTAMSHRRDAKAAALEIDETEEIEGADPQMSWLKVVMFLGLGLIGLPLGADVLVESATRIAHDYGVSDTVIGLSLVAVGTSLPELATSVMAAMRGQSDVALGNVIGSNMFNLLAIIGVASLVGPIPVERPMVTYDLLVMLAASALLAPFVFRGWRLGKRWGIVFVALYAAYIFTLLGK